MWVLYNCAHKNTPIKSLDGDAWIRILGFFSQKQEALNYAQKLNEFDEGLEIRICPQGEFRVLMRDKCTEFTRGREIAKHEYLLAKHKETRKEAFANASENALERKMGDLKFDPIERAKAHEEEFKPQKQSKTPPRLKLLPETKKIDMTLRMQRFAALAVIPDYEHKIYVEKLVSEWENKRDCEYSEIKNKLLRDTLQSKQLPSLQDLCADWVLKNPPFKGTNVYGQLSNNLWIKNESEILKNTEVQAWISNFKYEYDKNLWSFLGVEKPDRASNLLEWILENPIPSEFQGSEPLVSFLHFTDSEDDMKKWIETSKLKDVDLACVTMYEWIKVNQVFSDKIKKSYRDPMLNHLHFNKEFQRLEAEKLEGNIREIVVSNE